MAKKAKAGIDQIHMQNAIKTLAANIRFASVDDPIRSIAVTSSVPNEGKTTIAIQLAQAMASSGKTVLLVECDMRRRSLANALGLHARTGIYSVLCGQNEIGDAVVSTLTRGMYFLDSEPHIPNPDVLLNSKRFRRFVEQALGNFDYVIFDTPPLSAFIDAAVLSTVVDGVLLVVGQNVVRRDELAKSHEQLKKADANIIGAVMNLCESEKNEYYTEYYTRGNSSDADAPAAPAAPASRAVFSRWPPCPGLCARTCPCVESQADSLGIGRQDRSRHDRPVHREHVAFVQQAVTGNESL